MIAELSVIGGAHAGQTIRLTEKKFQIGRGKDCHFRPDSRLVSRHHCVLRQDNDTLRIRDMGSKNGTFVNGQRIRREAVLVDGDMLVIGEITMKIIIRQAG